MIRKSCDGISGHILFLCLFADKKHSETNLHMMHHACLAHASLASLALLLAMIVHVEEELEEKL